MNRSDLNKFKGKDVNIDYQGSDAEMTSISGKLVNINDEEITIDYGTGVIDISISLINKVESAE